MIKDLPKKRAKNVKVEPITTAGLSKEVQKLKDALKVMKYERKVEKMFKGAADYNKKKK